MTITIQSQLPVIIFITIVILVILKIVNKKLEAYDPLSKPTSTVAVCIMIVELIDGFVGDIVSEKYVERMGPYIGSIAIYVLFSNYIGLLGLDNPTGNYSVTLALTAITWIMIQKTSIKYNGIGGYIHGFFEPIFLFIVPNVLGTIAPLLSMSLRLFGNNLSGGIVMKLVYNLGNTISNAFWSIFGLKDIFNFIGPIIAAPLHVYFDLFSGFIQMYIFIMLAMSLVGNNIPEEEKKLGGV